MYGGSRTGTFFLPAPGSRLRPRSGTFFLPLPRLGRRRNPRSQAPATSSWEVPTGGRAILLPTPSPKRCRGPQRCLPTSPGAGSFRPLPFVPPQQVQGVNAAPLSPAVPSPYHLYQLPRQGLGVVLVDVLLLPVLGGRGEQLGSSGLAWASWGSPLAQLHGTLREGVPPPRPCAMWVNVCLQELVSACVPTCVCRCVRVCVCARVCPRQPPAHNV